MRKTVLLFLPVQALFSCDLLQKDLYKKHIYLITGSLFLYKLPFLRKILKEKTVIYEKIDNIYLILTF